MSLKKPFGIMTLSFNARSKRLLPEWPWRTRRYRIVPEESEQYWMFFFSPPLTFSTEFVNKVRNQVRIRQKRMSSIAENCTEHSIIWGMFMATTLNAATFMGKNYSTMQNVVKNEESLTLKQMFDVTSTNGSQWGRNLLFGQNRVSEEYLDTTVFD